MSDDIAKFQAALNDTRLEVDELRAASREFLAAATSIFDLAHKELELPDEMLEQWNRANAKIRDLLGPAPAQST